MTATTHYGPYDVTDYKTWQTALDAVSSGSTLVPVIKQNKILFIEIPGLSFADDGTYITVSSGSTALFRVRKSDGQFQVAGGYDTDITL